MFTSRETIEHVCVLPCFRVLSASHGFPEPSPSRRNPLAVLMTPSKPCPSRDQAFPDHERPWREHEHRESRRSAAKRRIQSDGCRSNRSYDTELGRLHADRQAALDVHSGPRRQERRFISSGTRGDGKARGVAKVTLKLDPKPWRSWILTERIRNGEPGVSACVELIRMISRPAGSGEE